MMADMPQPLPVSAQAVAAGEFLEREITTADGPRRYKLYIPSSYDKSRPAPLLVVLHGCTQDPDDIARGTRFNDLAEEEGVIVAYPEQPVKFNGLKCWNWFDSSHQAAETGEPALIAAITNRVFEDYSVDSRRVYIAGLSAGAAMALSVAYAYPDLYAAAGVHSGIAYGAATTIADALGVMHGGAAQPAALSSVAAVRLGASRRLPLIVFQGLADKSVSPVNAGQIVSQAAGMPGLTPMARKSESRHESAGGYHFTRRIYAAASLTLEEWTVDELGHAWSGGSPDGTYTDPRGPDASAEMMRFFLENPKG